MLKYTAAVKKYNKKNPLQLQQLPQKSSPSEQIYDKHYNKSKVGGAVSYMMAPLIDTQNVENSWSQPKIYLHERYQLDNNRKDISEWLLTEDVVKLP